MQIWINSNVTKIELYKNGKYIKTFDKSIEAQKFFRDVVGIDKILNTLRPEISFYTTGQKPKPEWMDPYDVKRVEVGYHTDILIYDKKHFKDYEYGWYLHAGTFNGNWINSGPGCDVNYEPQYKEMIKELPRLKSIIFKSGDYREV